MLRVGRAVLTAVVLVAVTACGGTSTPPAGSSPSASPTSAAPVVGSCRDLTYQGALASSDTTPTVPCSQQHTAVTVAIGSLGDPASPKPTDLSDASIQKQLAASCPQAVHTYVGGDDTTFDLSMVHALWFIPTRAEIARGATWYRCDLVVVSGPEQLQALPVDMQKVLAAPNALNQWGICGSAAPSDKTFRRLLCSTPHTWRATAIVQIPPNTAYLDKTATTNAGNQCKAVAQKAANGALKFTWSFEWPNDQEWQAGQRYGWCWLPTTN